MSGRRVAAWGRPGAELAVGTALVAACLALAALVRPVESPAAPPTPPALVDVTRADLVCPAGAGTVALASLRGETGQATRVAGRRERDVRLRAPGIGVAVGGASVSVITARGDLAPGLIAGGVGRGAAPCVEARDRAWFTGATGRSDRPSVLHLMNPDRGPGFVDVQVLTGKGEVVVPGLRGLRVPGRGAATVDLAEAVPQEGMIALGVRVSRGRVGALLRAAETDPETGRETSATWLAGQPAPEGASELLALPDGAGGRTLVLANPGDSESAVEVRVLTRGSTFAPEGMEPVRVPPGSVRAVDLRGTLSGRGAGRAVGVVLNASSPVTASVRSVADGDLALTGAAASLAEVSGAVLPAGERRRLVVSGATERTAVEVGIVTRRGAVRTVQLSVRPGRASELALPPAALAVRMTASAPGLRAAVAVAGAGPDPAATVGLISPTERALVPAVTPDPR